MEKLAKESFKGIDCIRLHYLPLAQASLIRDWLAPRHIIKIQVNEIILSDCVLFKHYEEWLSTQGITETLAAQTADKKVASSTNTYPKVAVGS